jgi:hypothetical protein
VLDCVHSFIYWRHVTSPEMRQPVCRALGLQQWPDGRRPDLTDLGIQCQCQAGSGSPTQDRTQAKNQGLPIINDLWK